MTNPQPSSATTSQEVGLLFEYALKFLLGSAFLELVLYRLVSRLGMHLSKVSEKYEAVRLTFQGLSSIGFLLLNVTAILAFLVIFIVLIQKIKTSVWKGSYDRLLVPILALLVALTLIFLVFPPAMLGSVVYNLLSLTVFAILMMEFMKTHRVFTQRLMLGCFFIGTSSWLYYQTMTTTYGLFSIVTSPPLVNAVSRLGEALMVLASILTFWAYGTTSFRTKNKQQRRWGLTLILSGGLVLFLLLFLDFFLSWYSAEVAREVRKVGEGIGWIFQMGMGYTFYLPFAFYVLGLICWSYTVIKLVIIGRLAGYGLGLMFMAGYALQLSHLTLMVVLGLLLMNMDKHGTLGKLRDKINLKVGYQPIGPVVGQTRLSESIKQ